MSSTASLHAFGSTTVGAIPQQPSSPSASPLAPKFDRKTAPFKAQIRAAQKASEDLGKGFYACAMEVGFANVRGRPTFHGYGTHKPMSATMGLPTGGRLDLTVCLNVSGHDLEDRPNAREALLQRAKDNRYVIQVTHPDGRKERMTGIEAKGALSTAQDISIQGVKPGKLVIEAWPEQSAGVGGYVEGRRLEIDVRPA